MEKDTANMPTYSIEHPSWPGCVCVAVYELPWVDNEGRRIAQLRQVTFNERSAYGFIYPVLLRLPSVVQYSEYQLPMEFQKLTAERCVVRNTTTQDLTFLRFWNAYGYKVGNKARVQKKWDRLPEGEKILALGSIPRYRRFTEQKHIDLTYPETYIDQRRWENEYTNN